MNLLIFLDLTYNPCKNVKFCYLQGKNVQFFLIFTYNQGKIFLTLPITWGRGGTCIPSLHWVLPPPPQTVQLFHNMLLFAERLLFLIYLNDMPNPSHHQTNKSQFADDAGQWAVSKNIDLAVEYLQRNLDKLARWCAK